MPDLVLPEINDKAISSAEMTAHWRSAEPKLSADLYSTLMATEAGRNKADIYQKNQYPFAARHFSLRAGYFMNSALKLLFRPDSDYDSILSIGSGFSLLTYTIALAFRKNESEKELYILDSDIQKILESRRTRLIELGLDEIEGVTFDQQVLDIEKAFSDRKSVKECFNPNVKNPILILEGLSYFLTPECLQWLFDGIQEAYPSAAIIWDYWPDNMLKRSRFFHTVLEYFKNELPENVNALIESGLFSRLTRNYKTVEIDLSILEKSVIGDQLDLVLTDENTHIPARMGTLCAR